MGDAPAFTSTAKNVDEAILEVMGRVGYVKKTKSAGLSYTFAGERAIIRAIRTAMIQSQLIMLPVAISDIAIRVYESKSGSVMTNTALTYTFRLLHVPSNTWHDVPARGEGADAGDKSSPKAVTGALKDAIRKAFILETGDDPDNTPSEALEQRGTAQKKAPVATRPTPVAPNPEHTREKLIAAAAGLGFSLEDVGKLTPTKYKPFKPEHYAPVLGILQAESAKRAKAAKEAAPNG